MTPTRSLGIGQSRRSPRASTVEDAVALAQAVQAPPAPQPRGDVRWLRPAAAAPRTVDSEAVGRRLDVLPALDAAAWRASQLTALLIGADLDAGPGGDAARWDAGVAMRPLDLASRAGLSAGEIEAALDRLREAGVLHLVEGDAAPESPSGGPGALVRVAPAFVTDGPAAAVAWGPVTQALSGSAAGLLAVRGLAGLLDRPGRATVVPYAALVRATRYSEGMVKRGVAAGVDAGVVVHHPSRGRAPAYAFADWALGRVDLSAALPGAPYVGRADRQPSQPPVGSRSHAPAAPAKSPTHTPARPPVDAGHGAERRLSGVLGDGMLRARIAGVDIEVPAASGAEVEIETVVDGRPVTARVKIPPVRD